jgi:hypothetical protein
MKSQDALLLKFMESAIEKINRSLANIYAIQQVLIEKAIVTQSEMLSKIHEAEELPERKVGMNVLQDMINEFNSNIKPPPTKSSSGGQTWP